jgi:predicted amidohydrolase YtcJ
MKFSKLFLAGIIALLIHSCSEPLEADLIIHNALIYSVNDQMETHEAMAIKDGRIIELGAEHQILNKYNSEVLRDAEKAIIYPGFIDAHNHFLGYGLTRAQLDLIGTNSFEEVLIRIGAYLDKNDVSWVLGRGWDQNDWEVSDFPNNDILEDRFPELNIAIKRVDGHAILVSKSVLNAARIDRNTQINGGQIVLGQDGEPTGILIDEAMTLLEDIIPEPDIEHKTNAMKVAEKECFAVGLTSVTDAGLEVDEINLINKLQQEGSLTIRINAMYSAKSEFLNDYSALGIKTESLTAKTIKVYCDGALGSRGARLIDEYSDDSSSYGFFITPPDSIAKWAKMCNEAGFQLAVHCIGTAGNQVTLNEMAKVLGGTNDKRWRIEHAQVVHPEDRAKFGEFNILPSMQPTHATSDMYWAEKRLGSNRITWAYSLKSLMDQNGMVPLGTDFPVEGISPLNTFYSAVFRSDIEGYPEGGFNMDEALTREQALKGMTIWAAISSFNDEIKGSLELGKLADFVILDKDILNCEKEAILGAEIIATYISGQSVYEK